MNYLRYDRLYSTNELVALFCGAEKKAQDLDEKIGRLNKAFTKGHFNHNFPSKPEIKDAGVDIGAIAESGLIIDKAVRAYSLSLEEVPKDHVQLVYDRFISEIDRHARINGRAIDGINNLPIIVEAPNKIEAEVIAPYIRDELRTAYTGRPERRMDEVIYYLKALFFLALSSRPSNVHVF